MADLLVRGVSESVLTQIDARAQALGLSRAEYVRRTLERDAQQSRVEVTLADFLQFSATFQDLKDDELMERAWH